MEKYRLAKIIAAASQLYVLTVNAATLTPSPTSPAEIDLPFTVKEGFILIQGSVDASRGVFMLDTGTPFDFFINRFSAVAGRGGWGVRQCLIRTADSHAQTWRKPHSAISRCLCVHRQ